MHWPSFAGLDSLASIHNPSLSLYHWGRRIEDNRFRATNWNLRIEAIELRTRIRRKGSDDNADNDYNNDDDGDDDDDDDHNDDGDNGNGDDGDDNGLPVDTLHDFLGDHTHGCCCWCWFSSWCWCWLYCWRWGGRWCLCVWEYCDAKVAVAPHLLRLGPLSDCFDVILIAYTTPVLRIDPHWLVMAGKDSPRGSPRPRTSPPHLGQ